MNTNQIAHIAGLVGEPARTAMLVALMDGRALTARELADAGRAVLLISSDLPELVGLSDRVLVLRDGHLIGELPKERLSEESVLLAMNGEFPDGA